MSPIDNLYPASTSLQRILPNINSIFIGDIPSPGLKATKSFALNTVPFNKDLKHGDFFEQ